MNSFVQVFYSLIKNSSICHECTAALEELNYHNVPSLTRISDVVVCLKMTIFIRLVGHIIVVEMVLHISEMMIYPAFL